jgi:hypothetical protein
MPARRAAIPDKFHWVRIGGNLRDLRFAHTFAVAAYGQFIATDPVYVANPFPAGNVGDYGDFGIQAARLTEYRIDAIMLGSVRNGIEASYSIAPGEIHPDESTPGTIINLDPAANPPTWSFTSGHANANDNFTALEAAIAGFADFTEEEQQLAAFGLIMGASLPPVVGLSLHESGHHYLTGHSKAFLAVENQALSMSTQYVRNTIRGDILRFRDIINHKACHPVTTDILKALALSVAVKNRLNIAGMGSATVRLPYVEGQIKQAAAMIAIVDSVQTFAATYQCVFSVADLKMAYGYVSMVPLVGAAPVLPVGARFALPATRGQAIEGILVPAINAALAVTAYCSGILWELIENTDSNIRPAADSRFTAYSISKLRTEKVAEVYAGSELARNARRFTRGEVEKGIFSPIEMRA